MHIKEACKVKVNVKIKEKQIPLTFTELKILSDNTTFTYIF